MKLKMKVNLHGVMTNYEIGMESIMIQNAMLKLTLVALEENNIKILEHLDTLCYVEKQEDGSFKPNPIFFTATQTK